MHFRNNRKSSIIDQKQSRPCPYHSRVGSGTSEESKHERSNSVAYAEYVQINRNSNSQSNRGRNHRSGSNRLPKIKNMRVPKTETRQALIEPSFFSFGERLVRNQNYYEDLKLENQGWPCKYYREGKLAHAWHDDVVEKARQEVRQIYKDGYSRAKEELTIINRIKLRCKVLRNIEQDKIKYRSILKEAIQNPYENDGQNQQEKETSLNDDIFNS